jgi:hypothetical protein
MLAALHWEANAMNLSALINLDRPSTCIRISKVATETNGTHQ